ncbi:unnamed protein product [Mytilus coruscus]|uniref:Uncharacterized protein n=1 Tax=Mytilus coruscus TaxID=42192 RepID=A0A6J8BNF4_MYTCO|nr:unnamed protein product [Mytilus coruscus]
MFSKDIPPSVTTDRVNVGLLLMVETVLVDAIVVRVAIVVSMSVDYEESKNVKKTLSTHIDLSEFEAIYVLKTSLTPDDKDLNRFLLQASEEKQPCLCRYILSKLRHINMNRSIHLALKIAFSKEDIQTARVLSWCITKIFYNLHQEKLSNATNIYPGLRCICKEKSSIKCHFCLKSREHFVIVVVQQEKDPQLPNQFRKIDIEYVSPNVSSRSEGNTILEYLTRKKIDSFSLKVNISNQKAQTLFLKHNNLGLICPSIGRSRFFSSEDHSISDEQCIQLHCTKKGIIPIGNEHFPSIINGCPTDVIEAQPLLLSNLRIGDKVGPETSTGTLGGFVKYRDVYDCFLTCAHVMYDVKSLLESSSDFTRLSGAKAYLHNPQGTIECGNVILRAFCHDDISRTSVDAALVELTNASVNPNDIISGFPSPRTCSDLGLSSFLLNDICLDREELRVSTQTVDTVSAGAMTKLLQNITLPRQSHVDVQFSNTGSTAASVNANVYHPLWIYSPAHLQLPSGYLTDRRIFRMYNQMAVNLPLVEGDSGTCIYIVNHPGNKNGCIGMAIAFCGGLTLVTPLKDIFKE